MKRSVCLLLVLCCVLPLCACGSTSDTPFDKLQDNPGYDEVQKRYGDNAVIKSDAFGWVYLYYTYPWHGCNGELKIDYSAKYEESKDGISVSEHNFQSASWEYSGHDLSKTRDEIVGQLESKYGKADTDTSKYSSGKNVTNYKWRNGDKSYILMYTVDNGVDTIKYLYNI